MLARLGMRRSPVPRLPGSLLSFTLTVKDHFAIPAGVITVSVNTEYDDAVPAAALVKPSAFMAGSNIEAEAAVFAAHRVLSTLTSVARVCCIAQLMVVARPGLKRGDTSGLSGSPVA